MVQSGVSEVLNSMYSYKAIHFNERVSDPLRSYLDECQKKIIS